MFNLPQSTFGRRSFLRFSALSAALSKAARLFALKPITLQVTRAIIVRFALACAAVH